MHFDPHLGQNMITMHDDERIDIMKLMILANHVLQERHLIRFGNMTNLSLSLYSGNWTPGISGQTCLAKSDLLLSILDLQRLD